MLITTYHRYGANVDAIGHSLANHGHTVDLIIKVSIGHSPDFNFSIELEINNSFKLALPLGIRSILALIRLSDGCQPTDCPTAFHHS